MSPIVVSGEGQTVTIVTSTTILKFVSGGARGAKGDPGPPGPPGSSGGSGVVWEQTFPATEWNVLHDLGYHPSVTIIDSSDRVVEGDVHYGNVGELTVSFLAPFSGRILMS